ncbi:MAG: beta-propeller domain-containing protein [Pseudomonadales bacterium]
MISKKSLLGVLAPVLLMTLIASCGGGGGGNAPETPVATPSPAPAPKGLLVQIAGSDELREKAVQGLQNYFEERLRSSTESSDLEGIATLESDSGDGSGDSGTAADAGMRTETVSFTTTYTLEKNVDEYDFVKYDGDRMFVAPTRGLGCCFGFVEEVLFDDIVDDGSGDGSGSEAIGSNGDGSAATEESVGAVVDPAIIQNDQDVRGIRVLKTNPAEGLAQEEASIPLEENQSVEGLYLVDSKLIALTSVNWWGRYGDDFSDAGRWSGGSVGLDIYDVASESNYDRLHQLQIEGVLVNSRRTEAGIFVVTRHSPNIEGLNYYPASQEELDNNQNLLEGLETQDFLPLIERDGVALEAVAASDCYALNAEDQDAPERSGSPTISMVLQIDPDTAEVIDSVCLLEPIDGVYLTTESLYFTQVVYEGDFDTLIHQFELAQKADYLGSVRLQGGLFLGGNNDYRVNASGPNLRVVLSQWQDDVDDRIDHTLFVLAPSDEEPALEVIGQLPSETRPDEIGKPNEDLYGVRFIGDRAYFVTFERIDPLYVIDLSNPADPFIAGSLEVPGFSDFLHPVSQSVLLGLGRSDTRLTKLEFFDVSDLTAPQSLGALTLDDSLSYSYSQAEYNRKAFTYWRASSDTHRMAIPVEGYLRDPPYTNLARLYLFEIANPENPSALTLTSPGFLEVDAATNIPIWGQQRSIFHDDAVFWVIEQDVITSFWDNPSQSVLVE